MSRVEPGWLFFAVQCLVWTVMGRPASAQQDQPPTPVPGEPWLLEQWLDVPIHGSLATRYRFRSNGGDRDQDLDEYLIADAGEPDRHAITAHLFLRASEDLDGNRDPEGFFAFDNISDTYSSNLNARFYYGHLDLHRLGPIETARAGRQIMDETPLFLYYDGGWVESTEWKGLLALQAGLYAGVPVHLYESSTSGDSIFGGYVQAKPWVRGRFRVDYTRARDAYVEGTQRDDYFAFALWQNLGGLLRVHAQHSILERENREFTGRVHFYEPVWDLQLQVSYTELFNTQKVLTLDFDSFFFAAQEYFPYRQGRLLVAKGFGDHFRLEAGADARELRNEGEEAPLNREFRRVHLTPSVLDWPSAGLGFSATLEAWDVPGTDNGDILTGGFEASHRVSQALKISAGTSYALYKYDFFLAKERENVRMLYANVSWKLPQGAKFNVAYAFEHDDLDDFHTLKIGVTYSY